MKFYLCQTSDGPRYARTQADAKALDKNFELVEYPVDQGALVQRFNDLMASAPPEQAFPSGGVSGQVLDHDDEGQGVWVEPPVKPKKVEPPKKDRLWDQIELEEHIFSIDHKNIGKLDAIERTVAARRSEIEKGIMV